MTLRSWYETQRLPLRALAHAAGIRGVEVITVFTEGVRGDRAFCPYKDKRLEKAWRLGRQWRIEHSEN